MFDIYRRYFYRNFISFMLAILISCPQIYSQKIKIMLLGDSITKGSSHEKIPTSFRTGYRQTLWLLLTSHGFPVDFVGSESIGFNAFPKFDPDNAGFGGYSTRQLLHLLETGYGSRGKRITPGPYLYYYPADVILLHIGTNQLETSVKDVDSLLDYIYNYADSTNTRIWVILAKIINEVPYNLKTTFFNNNIEKMAERRIRKGDKLKIVDMEKRAGLVYKIDTAAPFIHGDFYDRLHPNVNGYNKMAELFFDTLNVLLTRIIPVEFEGISYYINKNNTILFWQTDIELDNFGFKIERSGGNNVWRYLGFVKGAGNSHQVKTYYFVDSISKNSADNFIYRLKQIEDNKKPRTIAQLETNTGIFKKYSLGIKWRLSTWRGRPDASRVNVKGTRLPVRNNFLSVNYTAGNESQRQKSSIRKIASGIFFYILNTLLIDQHSLLYFTRALISLN